MDVLNGFRVYKKIEEHIQKSKPFSLIRLGDGEGAVLGYPNFTSMEDINKVSRVWFDKKSLTENEIERLSILLQSAISNSDIVGLPRESQVKRVHRYQAVNNAIEEYDLLTNNQLLTDAAIHQYLQFALLYRPILKGRDFIGLISSRDLCSEISRVFGVQRIQLYQIKGESGFPGSIKEDHFPEKFEWLLQNIDIPYQGALFLVGAGVFGKIYCDVIKKKGGIAIDVGAIFDAWAGVNSRLKKPCHKLRVYEQFPEITARRALIRYNRLINEFDFDTTNAKWMDIKGMADKW